MKEFIIITCIFLLFSCGEKKESKNEIASNPIPNFNSDSCYSFIETQINFGPRIPNTESHRQAGDYFVSKLNGYGAEVETQEFKLRTYDGKTVALKNIEAHFFPKNRNRIVLAAHWDTRPFSDKDRENPMKEFDGANDGASGVAVILEIARLLSEGPTPNVGIDIILFDGEDWGEHASGEQGPPSTNYGLESWWCLGSQYWAEQSKNKRYSINYGILLDMVGARGSHFYKEGVSVKYAKNEVNKIWGVASRLGYSPIFINQNKNDIMDDHVFMNRIAEIPTVAIVSHDPIKGYFGDFHHTQKDNLALISKETLGIVGTVIVTLIYEEKKV